MVDTNAVVVSVELVSGTVVDTGMDVVDPTAGEVDIGMDVVVNGAVVVISTSGGSVTPPHGFPVGVHRSLLPVQMLENKFKAE